MIRLLKTLAGRIDYYRKPDRRNREWPMNGQDIRIRAVQEIVQKCGIARIIETGTHLGNTTVWFARLGLPLITVEINPRWAEFSRMRLRQYGNVTVRQGNSVDVLRDLVSKIDNRELPTLFYLDAHWFDHLPLREEAELIVAHFPNAVIVVDDFEVPGDDGYGFDDYGPDKKLSADYLSALKTLNFYFPAKPSSEETGRKRGWVVLTASPALTQILDGLPSLRRWPASN